MNQVVEFFLGLLSISEWPPRWHCGEWSDFHGWLYIISDLLIWSAYFAIPILIIKYISKRKEVKFHGIYFLFAAFILACGCTHFLDAVAFWYPAYRLNAVTLFITGVISWITVYHLIKLLPAAFSMKSSKQLEAEVEQRTKAENDLAETNAYLNEAEKIARVGYWEWNLTTKEILCSEGLYNIFCISRKSGGLTIENFLDNVHPDDKAYVRSVTKQAIKSKDFSEYFCRIICNDKTVKTVFAKGQVTVNDKNKVVKIKGILQDVTQQKKAEQDIILKSKELENLNIELQQFAYVASHDLQEPLRKIRTYTSLLEDKLKGNLNDAHSEYIEKINTSSVRMQNLIKNILEFSKINIDHSTYSLVNLNTVMEQVLISLEVSIENTHAKISIQQLPEIEGDDIQLSQLFQNLLTNAIKFTREGKVPEIAISSETMEYSTLPQADIHAITTQFGLHFDTTPKPDDLYCKICITDNGIGFDEVYLDKIFTIFQRLNSNGRYEGTGIGLAICKRIVDHYQGLISAKSKEGEGSTFIVLLPFRQRSLR